MSVSTQLIEDVVCLSSAAKLVASYILALMECITTVALEILIGILLFVNRQIKKK